MAAREALLVFRRRSLWVKAGMIFVHVPKNAGSSVNDALYGQFMGHIPAWRIKQLAPKTFTRFPSFALLRDPVNRCRSAYEFAKAGRGEGAGLLAGMNRPERYKIPEFNSFEQFVTEWLPLQNLDAADPVFRSQSSYVCDRSGAIIVGRLGTVETLANMEGWLTQQLGRPVVIGHTNRTPRTSEASKIDPATQNAIRHLYRQDCTLYEQVTRGDI